MKLLGAALLATALATSAAAEEPLGKDEWLTLPPAVRDAYLLGLFHGYMGWGPLERSFAVEDCLARNNLNEANLPGIIAKWAMTSTTLPEPVSGTLAGYFQLLCMLPLTP